ncbi:hypothetical protein ABEO79_00105 [Micromonospora provocatoris]
MKKKNDVVIINLDRPREIRFGHKAMKKIEAQTGKSALDMDIEKFNFEELEVYMYCGLLSDAKQHNEDLKLEDMEDLLDIAPMFEIMEKMYEALAIAMSGEAYPSQKNSQRIASKKTTTPKE